MKRSRFTEEQVIAVLREQEVGLATAEGCRKHGVSGATFCAWEAKHGGLDVSRAREPKALEEENARLKKLLAEAVLDNAVVLQDVPRRNLWSAPWLQGVRGRWTRTVCVNLSGLSVGRVSAPGHDGYSRPAGA